MEGVTSPNDNNIIAGALKGSSSFSKATVFTNLESLLKESMQHLKKAHKKVITMFMLQNFLKRQIQKNTNANFERRCFGGKKLTEC